MREAAVGSLPKNRQLEHPQSPERSGVAVGQGWALCYADSTHLASGVPKTGNIMGWVKSRKGVCVWVVKGCGKTPPPTPPRLGLPVHHLAGVAWPCQWLAPKLAL